MIAREISFFSEDSAPYGKTYGSWTVDWWRWILGIPRLVNPVLDMTGEYANTNQQNNDVVFLVGKLASKETNMPNRRCTISSTKSILFPIVSCESNQLEDPELQTDQDIVERVSKDEDTIIKKECYVDNKKIQGLRIRSDPIIFELNMVEDNLFSAKGGITRASADGYWVFLKPLARGSHIISFQGSCEYGRLNSGALYHLDIR